MIRAVQQKSTQSRIENGTKIGTLEKRTFRLEKAMGKASCNIERKIVSFEHIAKSRKSKLVYVPLIVCSFTYPCVSNSPPMIRANMIAPIITPADIAPI